ncbi:hypothetical protein PybrP1_013064 [[Pythium] brassicae (nom. inval.)]|nr:hypothetical protein PybrP1_013064 [[Pythium] brassicae (nom. inval.)]
MAGCNVKLTPEAVKQEDQDERDDVKHQQASEMSYRELVGALQYLVSGSRLDIAHAVRALGQYLTCYTAKLYLRAKRVPKYLKATEDVSLYMRVEQSADKPATLEALTDADYANDKDDREKISGYAIFFDGNVVSYGSRKQALNAQSTAKAEYLAMNEGKRDLMWMKGCAMSVSGSARFQCWGKHTKSKHIENKYHYARHQVEAGHMTTRFCPADDMTADIMPKELASTKFEKFRTDLGVLHMSDVLKDDRQTAFTAQTTQETTA